MPTKDLWSTKHSCFRRTRHITLGLHTGKYVCTLVCLRLVSFTLYFILFGCSPLTSQALLVHVHWKTAKTAQLHAYATQISSKSREIDFFCIMRLAIFYNPDFPQKANVSPASEKPVQGSTTHKTSQPTAKTLKCRSVRRADPGTWYFPCRIAFHSF